MGPFSYCRAFMAAGLLHLALYRYLLDFHPAVGFQALDQCGAFFIAAFHGRTAFAFALRGQALACNAFAYQIGFYCLGTSL